MVPLLVLLVLYHLKRLAWFAGVYDQGCRKVNIGTLDSVLTTSNANVVNSNNLPDDCTTLEIVTNHKAESVFSVHR